MRAYVLHIAAAEQIWLSRRLRCRHIAFDYFRRNITPPYLRLFSPAMPFSAEASSPPVFFLFDAIGRRYFAQADYSPPRDEATFISFSPPPVAFDIFSAFFAEFAR